MIGRFLGLAFLGLAVLAAVAALTSCAASASWTLARGTAATGPTTAPTCATSDHWDPAAIRELGGAVGAAAGAAAAEAAGVRALRPPVPVPGIRQ